MLLQIFLVEKIYFVALLPGSHTAVYNVSSKNAYFYLGGQCRTGRTCCCVSMDCRYLSRGKKSSRSCFRRFLQAPASPPPMGPTSLLKWGSDSPSSLDGLCKPSRAGCTFRAGGPSAASTRVPCLMYRLVQQFIAFQCCCYMLRATALTFAVLKALNTWNTITSVNLCWNPSP